VHPRTRSSTGPGVIHATCLLLLIALTIAGVLLASVAALAAGTAFDWTIATTLAGGSVALNGIFLAAELPAYFGTGPGPIRIIASIPPGVILTAVLYGSAVPRAALCRGHGSTLGTSPG
jgi:hypothetical protein